MSYQWKRQTFTYIEVDDQSPLLDGAFVGNWKTYTNSSFGAFNNTLTVTTTPGSLMGVEFEGTEIIIWGALAEGNTKYPSATYSMDYGTAGSSEPYTDSTGIVYYKSPSLAATNHTLIVNVTDAGPNYPYALDYAMYVPDANTPSETSGTSTTQTSVANAPSVSKKDIGAIVGGVIGGVAALIIVGLTVFYFMRKKRNQPYYFDKPTPEQMLGPEAEIQPFPHQDAHSPSLHPAPSAYGSPSAYMSGEGSALDGKKYDKDGKLNSLGEPEMVQHADSGVRFGEGGPKPGIPTEVPPTYSPA